MNASKSSSHFLDMTEGSVLRLEHAAGTRITVWSGCVWITQQDDSRDIVLAAGQHFTLDRHGLTLIQSLKAGELRVDTPQARPLARLPVVSAWAIDRHHRIGTTPMLAFFN